MDKHPQPWLFDNKYWACYECGHKPNPPILLFFEGQPYCKSCYDRVSKEKTIQTKLGMFIE